MIKYIANNFFIRGNFRIFVLLKRYSINLLKYKKIHKQHKIEIKINQLRIKNWYFKPIEIISIQEYRRKKLIKLSQE